VKYLKLMTLIFHVGMHKRSGEDMTNYNPMSLFDNRIPKFNTIQAKQAEYKETVIKLNAIQEELNIMWENANPTHPLHLEVVNAS